MKYFAQVDKLDNDVVVGTQKANTAIPSNAQYDWEEISAAKYGEINAQGFTHADGYGGGHCWERSAPATITEIVDTRPVLHITLSKTELDVGESVQIDLQAKDHQGNNLSINATKKIALLLNEAVYRNYKISVTNGTNSYNRSFASTGLYRIIPHGSAYRIDGDSEFEVIQDF